MNDLEDLAYPPSGGRPTQILVGIVLALAVVSYAVICFIQQSAWLPGRSGGNLDGVALTGEAARWLAGVYLGFGLFIHFQWFWGLVPAWPIHNVGKGVSAVLSLACIVRLMWLLFFY